MTRLSEIVLLNHLKKAVQHAPDFANVVGEAACRTDAVEFIEEINTACLIERFKNQTQLRRRLAHELCDEPVKANDEKGETQFACQGRSGQCLARTGVTDQKKLSPGRKPAIANEMDRPVLPDDSLKFLLSPGPRTMSFKWTFG